MLTAVGIVRVYNRRCAKFVTGKQRRTSCRDAAIRLHATFHHCKAEACWRGGGVAQVCCRKPVPCSRAQRQLAAQPKGVGSGVCAALKRFLTIAKPGDAGLEIATTPV